MNKGVRILLIAAAVACFGVALYYPINYGMQKNSNANDMDRLAALREAGMANEDQAKSTDKATEAEPPAETRVAPAEAAVPVEGETDTEEESAPAPSAPEAKVDESAPSEAQPAAQSGTETILEEQPEAAQGEAEPQPAAQSETETIQAEPQQIAQGGAEASQPQPAAQSEAEPQPAAQGEAEASQPQTAAQSEAEPQQAMQSGAEVSQPQPVVQGAAEANEAEPAAQSEAEPQQIAQGGAEANEAQPDAQSEAQPQEAAQGAAEANEAEPAAQGEAEPGEAQQETLEEEESDEPGVSKGIYVGPLETSSNGVAAAIIAQKMQEAIATTPEADTTPSPTPVPTPTPDRRERSGVLPYAAKEKVEFDESMMLERYKEIYAINNDLIGWITIPGTDVDYPVVQTENGEYYLEHDFYGEENINGQIILDPLCDPYTPSYNLVISGHNMRSGSMFGNLDNYTSKSYWSKHKFVEFDTLVDERQYVIFAAFYSADYDVDEDGFRYNRDIQYRVDADDWLDEIHRYQVYDTGIDAEFGDEFLTLTTCNHERRSDGRFVLVCRRIREGETIE